MTIETTRLQHSKSKLLYMRALSAVCVLYVVLIMSKLSIFSEAFAESHCTYAFSVSCYIYNALSTYSSYMTVPSFHYHIEGKMWKASYFAVISIALVYKHAKC